MQTYPTFLWGVTSPSFSIYNEATRINFLYILGLDNGIANVWESEPADKLNRKTESYILLFFSKNAFFAFYENGSEKTGRKFIFLKKNISFNHF